MTSLIKRTVFLTALLASGAAIAANPNVGGAPMFENKNIVENAVNSKDHTTLVAAVKAAGLVDTLMSDGPFTVFAPVNAGFEALPAGTVETLLKPENKGMLTKVLTSHVVSGKLNKSDIDALLAQGGGRTELTTVSGDRIAIEMRNGTYYVIDESANGSKITIADVNQSNGVIHVVNSVLLPQ
ncbi:fasciclin domain-containing protein [Algicella marina]|uniref:Fasciclin domain-containing protein n=1 Tax=Algicella marina TaxID=2683284 RepID=A0A6P1STU9_9RHOB|nr:fasciclin domain-containing protein [Algicella marina]QHQ33848.1 fasciclin domain-containing protein [Algicella marina]